MKHLLLATTAAVGVLAAASSASAADLLTGTITLTGHVDSKCSVVPNGGTTFGASHDLGDISQSNGTLRANMQTTTATTADSFQVSCTGANLGVHVNADAMTNATAAPAGYASTVNFTGRAVFQRVNAAGPVAALTVDNVSGTATTDNTLGAGNFLAATPANITISTFSFTTGTNTELLVAGGYSGQVVVTVTPS
jgi:hypothetical protein